MALIKEIQKSKIGFNDLLQLVQDNIFSRLNCHNIGRILEFDPATYTATVELMQIKQFYNESFYAAPITDVPLIMFGAGSGHITLPDPTGTICLLFFLDRNIDRFLETEEAYTPATTRMHSMSDCIAITTFKTLANPLNDYDDKAISIFMDEIEEEIKKKSSIKVYGGSVEIKSAIEAAEEENQAQSSLKVTPQSITANTAAGAQLQLTEKINLQNSVQSLALLMQSFLTVCAGIKTVTGGTLTPDVIEQFNQLKTQFEELLQ